MPYQFRPGEKTRFKSFSDYTSRSLSPWTDLEVKAIHADTATVAVDSSEFNVPAHILAIPLGWEEVYDVCNNEENLTKIYHWFKDRGGVNVWASHDLGSAGRTMFQPADVKGKPHWSMGFVETVTDPKRFKFLLLEESYSKPVNAKKEGWKYERKGGGIWWRETPWPRK